MNYLYSVLLKQNFVETHMLTITSQ